MTKRILILSLTILTVTIVFYGDSAFAQILSSDRVITWTPGVTGGIPNRSTVCATLSPSGGDDAPAINSAISNCLAGQVVQLNTGTFTIQSNVTINKGVTLRGQGPAKTILNETGTPGGYQLITLGAGSGMSSVISVSSGYTRGSTLITLSDASSINAGDYIFINQLNENTTTTVSSSGTGGTCTWCGADDNGSGGGVRTLGQMLRVVAKSGNNLTLEKGLYWNYVASALPQVRKITMVENAGIEALRLTQPLTYPVSHLLEISHCANCWAKNIEIKYGKQRHVEVRYSYRYEIRDSYFHLADSYGQDHGYCVTLWDGATDGLIENNLMDHCLLAVTFSGPVTGNVIAYNYSVNNQYTIDSQFLEGDYSFHGSHAYFNLLEGNYGTAAQQDDYWGSNSHNTWFRNRFRGWLPGKIEDLHAVLMDADQTYANFVGNVLGDPNVSPAYLRYETYNQTVSCYYNAPDIYKIGYGGGTGDCTWNSDDNTNAYTTILRHGNYDYYDNSVVWDASIPDHVIPNSYYLSAKPIFFGTLPWPPIGSDLSPMTGTLPAESRYLHVLKAPQVSLP